MRNELIVGGYSVDTIQDIDISITKEIYSISHPDKRQSDFTKTVEIPSSKVNDGIFGALFDVNMVITNEDQLNPDFNPTKKASCYYYQDQLEMISGYCQLDEIRVVDNNKVIYVIVIYGRNIDLFSRINNLTLNDATLDGGNDYWNDGQITASWTLTLNQENRIAYPMMDIGQTFDYRGGVSIPNSYDFNCFKPWTFVKYIWDRIFFDAGLTYESVFLESETFQRLILQCDTKNFTKNQELIDQSLIDVLRNTNQVMTLVANANVGTISNYYNTSNIIYPTVVQDNASQYTAANGTVTIDAGSQGYCTFDMFFYFDIQGVSNTVDFSCRLIRLRGGVYTVVEDMGFAVTVNVGANIVSMGRQSKQYVQAGDEFRVCFGNITLGGVVVNNSYSVTMLSSTSLKFNVNGQITYEDQLMLSGLQFDMKQTDFIMGIVNMFNLYLECHPNGVYKIEPRDDFYQNTVVDWTQKLDTSKDFVIKPQGLLENEEVLFTYQLNNEDLSNKFNQSTGYIHGYHRKIFDNDFVKDVKKIEIPFTLVPLDEYDGRVMMRTLVQGSGTEQSNKPIIAFYTGLIDGTGNNSNSWRYYDAFATTYTTYTTYPYAGHLDDIQAPENDLCFFRQPFYYFLTPNFGGLSLTTATLFNKYHYKYWTEIGSRDSKLVEAYFRLNTYDISTLSFQPIYWVDKAAYRLLGVIDHDPNEDKTTLVRLLKLDVVEQFDLIPEIIQGGNGQGNGTGAGGDGQLGGDGSSGERVADLTQSGIVLGSKSNRVGLGSSSVIFNGIENIVGENCKNISINGSGNTIGANLQNVYLIRTDNVVVTESNVTYIEGVKTIVGSPTDGQVATFRNNQIAFEDNVGGFTWNETTGTSDTLVPNNGYIANNGSLITYLLPSSASSTIGDIIRVRGLGSGGWKITQNANQVIKFTSASNTTVGVVGYIQSVDQFDYIEIQYVSANTWAVNSVRVTVTIF